MSDCDELIIVTRPQPYADELCDQLIANQFHVENCPLIEFVENDTPDLSNWLNEKECYDYIIFISQQAAQFFLQPLDKQQVSTIKRSGIIAVGKATQKVISGFNLESKTPLTADSEGILELLSSLLDSKQPANILLVCGNQGRKLLEAELAIEHTVKRLEVYQRVAIAQTFPSINNPTKTAVLATSEQLLSLSAHQLSLQQTPQMQTTENSLLQSVVFICASSRIEHSAKELGIKNTLVAASASNEDMLEAAINWRLQLQANDNIIQANFTEQNLTQQSDTMSESDQHENEIIEALELDQEQDNNQKPAKKGGMLKTVFWLLLLAAIGYGGYWLWNQDYFSGTASNTETNNELSRIVALEKQLKSQSLQIENLLNSNNQQSASNDELKQELARQVESLQQQLVASQRKFQSLSADAATQARDWQVAEAEYLIRQAAQKVHYSDDTASIIALLEAADQQILASGDTNLLGLRRAISQDIGQIKSNVSIDIDGILVKLDTIQSQLKDLTLASVKFEEAASSEFIETEITEDSAWQTFKGNIKNTFSDYYKVHSYDQSVKPFISPQQSDLLQQNILLSLQTAQLSALRHQQQSYDRSIAEVASWINEYYQKDSASNFVQEQLQQLAKAKVSVQLPNKFQSLDFIKSNNQERLNQWLQSSPLESPAASTATDIVEDDEIGESGNIDAKIKNTLERLEKTSDDSKKDGEQ
ncbi:uroporphyrinogen-III C-methyltransferase [Kangiella sp. HZ709]|uniref:uroporphyrinogen-III C-methyltransferase n=1 Tax=Kangiella sp. HZ709 TaxID=2666328 RepID=UPI0012B0F24B|nr:uroporphyrinogen-III C-methyltransferase [Kangiella sp. HZ709]MRX28024.1 hypothetical protein [Kangiella sp. HZ709]